MSAGVEQNIHRSSEDSVANLGGVLGLNERIRRTGETSLNCIVHAADQIAFSTEQERRTAGSEVFDVIMAANTKHRRNLFIL